MSGNPQKNCFIGNTTQRPSNGFVRHMPAEFPRNREFLKVIISQIFLAYAGMLINFFVQSDENSDCASVAQSLCSAAYILYFILIPFIKCGYCVSLKRDWYDTCIGKNFSCVFAKHKLKFIG